MSTDPIVPFQGGFPAKSGRGRHSGTGFFSFLKRFVVPLAKKALPHIVGGISDVVKGDDPKDVLKRRGTSAAHQLIDHVAGQPAASPATQSTEGPPPAKKAKKTKKPPPKKKKRGRR